MKHIYLHKTNRITTNLMKKIHSYVYTKLDPQIMTAGKNAIWNEVRVAIHYPVRSVLIIETRKE